MEPYIDPRAHIVGRAYSGNHKERLEKDKVCGCFHCLVIFDPKEIREWICSDHGDAQGTAICPHCGVDAVIGESSGLPITPAFLKRMQEFWFADPEEE